MTTTVKTRQILTFIVTWISYASTYLLRKPLGVVKPDLEKSLQLSKSQIGWLDAALLLPYAVMQMILGGLADKIGAGLALSICLVGASLSMISFGFWNHSVVLALLLFLNGTFQATAWPNCIKSLTYWYSDEHRATIFGLWGTCIFVGGILGTLLAVYIQSIYSPDLKILFIVPSLIVFTIGLVVFFTIKTPSDLNIIIPGKEMQSVSNKNDKVMSLYEIFSLKLVPELVVAVICIKLVRYCFYMWLPMYLHDALKYSKTQAGMLSTTFEIGGVIGSASIGIFINRVFNGRILYGCFFVVLSSAVALIFFEITSTWGIGFNLALLLIVGVCNCGPVPHLTGTVPAKIGEEVDAEAAVSGFVNGAAGIGAIIEGPIIGLIVDYYSWTGAFYFMIGLSIFSSFSLLKAAKINTNYIKDTRQVSKG